MASPAATIAHYDIVEELGRGGMGIVYTARDEKLGRTVALKVLSERLSSDPEAKARFLHEARAASALDHANICTIYEVGESDDGQLYIAMAYLEGRSLEDIVAEGPLGLARALDLTVKIGEGLAHSHERGIVHRDLKPSNVIVSDADDVKILDFGLAKILGATQLTVSGTTLGTAAYMSPEQAQGQRVDHRTDIWALGVLLYEMAAGVRPFQGEYQQALSYAIVNQEQEPLTGLRTGVPMDLDRIVFKALEKNPDDRYQHVEDLLVDLRKLIKLMRSTREVSSVSSVSVPVSRRFAWIPWSIAVIAIAVTIFFALRSDGDVSPHLSATVETDALALASHPLAPVLAIDPDGTRLVYAQRLGGSSVLVLRAFQSFTETRLEGTEGGHSPFFSPDGEWVGFMTGTKLMKIQLETGNVVAIADIPDIIHGGSWGIDGTIVVGLATELASVPAGGGALQVFARLDSADTVGHFLVWPQVVYGSDYVLCTTLNRSGIDAKILAVSRRDGSHVIVTEGGNPRYLRSGQLIFPRSGSLWSADFDEGSLTLSTNPVIVQGGVMTSFPQEPSLALYDVSEAGVLAFVEQKGASGMTFLSWIDESQGIEKVSDIGGAYAGVHLDPSGRRLVTSRRNEVGDQKLYVFDLDREMWTLLAVDGSSFWPHWGPDGQTIMATHEHAPLRFALATLRVGSVEHRILLMDEFVYQVSSWIPGSSDLLLQRAAPPDFKEFDIVRFRHDSDPEVVISTAFRETHPSVSPDGKWLAYAASLDVTAGEGEPGFEVFVRPMGRPEPQIQVSQGGGWAPKWSRDGSRLFYEASAAFMVVDWLDSSQASPSKARPFYTGPFVPSLVYGINYDVGPDGRLLLLLPDTETRNVRFVTGWLEREEG